MPVFAEGPPWEVCRANGSVLNEIAAGNYTAHAGLDICRGKVLDLVPRIRGDSCPELTYADAIAVLGAAFMAPLSYYMSWYMQDLNPEHVSLVHGPTAFSLTVYASVT